MLRTDKSENMNIPALEEFNMIRTGVIGDGSCFLHSIFTSMNARCFMGLSTTQRIEYVRNQRRDLSQKITFENWASLSNGVVSIQKFSKTIVNSIPFLENRISKKDINLEQIIRDSLHNRAENLKEFIDNFLKNIQNEQLLDLIRAYVNEEVPSLFRQYKEYIASSEAVDNTLITFLSDAYNLNIILINVDGSIYSSRTDITDMMLNDRPFILINYLDQSHFESIAEVGPEYNIRVFYRQSPVIQAILRDVTHPRIRESLIPHDRSNRITDDYKIVVGAKPIKETLENILKFDIIVNLTDDEWYKEHITKNKYINLPIKNGGVPKIKELESLIDYLIESYNKGKSIYIHCNGGHGRAGTIGAALLGKLYSLDANTAINRIIKYREERKDKSRNFIPTPETQTQVNFLVKMLGGDVVPDRKDTSWLKRVNKDRGNININTNEKILFYTDDKVYPQFSNYYVHDVIIDGVVYKSSEHAFQSKKFLYKGASKVSTDYAEVIRNVKTPNMSRILAIQKKMGGYAWVNQLNLLIDEYKEAKIDPNWDENRVDVMYTILRHKFQDPKMRQILLSTGDKEIVEHTSRDKFWADGGDGTGKNMLGKLLVKVREELK